MKMKTSKNNSATYANAVKTNVAKNENEADKVATQKADHSDESQDSEDGDYNKINPCKTCY